MAWDEGIDGVHREIAASTSKRIAVLAGPGTGKTSYGLIPRVNRLLEEGTSGDRILLISFTRTAARDLQEKVAQRGGTGSENIVASTLHAYCYSVLNREAVLTITNRTPRILLNHEQDLMLHDIQGDFGDIRQKRKLLSELQSGWLKGITQHPGSVDSPDQREFERQVLRWLRHHRAMLIGELVPIAYKFLRENPLSEENSRFDHIVVDEYQDLNYLEQRLISDLADRSGSSLCIIGDDDQSIYRFRQANPDGILSVYANPIFSQGQLRFVVVALNQYYQW